MRRLSHGGTRCPQRVGKVTAALPPDVLASSAIPLPSVRAGLAFSGEADHLGVQVERVVLNALGDDCGSAALYLRLRRFLCHRSEPDWHFPEKPIHPSPSAQKCNELAKLPVRAPRELASLFREFPHNEFQPGVRDADAVLGVDAVSESPWA